MSTRFMVCAVVLLTSMVPTGEAAATGFFEQAAIDLGNGAEAAGKGAVAVVNTLSGGAARQKSPQNPCTRAPNACDNAGAVR